MLVVSAGDWEVTLPADMEHLIERLLLEEGLSGQPASSGAAGPGGPQLRCSSAFQQELQAFLDQQVSSPFYPPEVLASPAPQGDVLQRCRVATIR